MYMTVKAVLLLNSCVNIWVIFFVWLFCYFHNGVRMSENKRLYPNGCFEFVVPRLALGMSAVSLRLLWWISLLLRDGWIDNGEVVRDSHNCSLRAVDAIRRRGDQGGTGSVPVNEEDGDATAMDAGGERIPVGAWLRFILCLIRFSQKGRIMITIIIMSLSDASSHLLWFFYVNIIPPEMHQI